MLGSPIGLALSALITSSLLRWTVIIVSSLGLIFALVFHLTRNDHKI